jgi:hypothetical protein
VVLEQSAIAGGCGRLHAIRRESAAAPGAELVACVCEPFRVSETLSHLETPRFGGLEAAESRPREMNPALARFT